MDGETLKGLIFLAAAVGLALAARSLFGGDAKPDPLAPPPPPGPSEPDKTIAPVGSELPFPAEAWTAICAIEPEERRPKVLNYYFRETDLAKGPQNPDDFIDEFFVEWESRDSGYRWTQEITVATPAGLARTLREEHMDFVFADNYLVVQRFNTGTILAALIEQFASYEAQRREQEQSPVIPFPPPRGREKDDEDLR